MKNLIPIIKSIELELRSNSSLSRHTWEVLSNLSDWDYRIVQDAILRINIFKQRGDLNFVYKLYEKDYPQLNKFKRYDLVIASLKRFQTDTVLTDIWNRLIIPENLTYNIISIWGLPVTQARNLAVEEACKSGAKYLLFVDDDILVPNNALVKLFNTMQSTKKLVVAGNYPKKVEPYISAHSYILDKEDGKIGHCNKVCAMGFTLINLEEISYKVPFPLFWEFGSPDGYWSMGEDAFFTKNLIEYTKEDPIVDLDINCLHYDKTWHKMYGEREKEIVYASNQIEDFEKIRIPPEYPLILIGLPTRTENEPIAVNLNELLLLRGYRSETFRVFGYEVDDARNVIVEEALKRNAKYILFIDNDIIPPNDGACKLIEHIEKDRWEVISGEYVLKGEPRYSAHLHLNKQGIVTELNRIENNNDLIESNWLTAMGFCLIKTDIFKQMRPPWFKCHAKGKETGINEDAHFTELCLENGYKILIDKSIKCSHVDFKTGTVYK